MNRLLYLLVLSFSVVLANSSIAQDVGGLPPGTTPDSLTNDILNAVETNGGPANTGNTNNGETSAGQTDGAGGTEDLGPDVSFEQTMIELEADTRNDRGFVGPSVASPDSTIAAFRFIGAQSDSLTNNTTRVNNSGRGGLGGGNAGSENGFNVQRTTPIRIRLVRSFRAPTIEPTFVSSRVNRRLSNLPATQQFSGSINVTMQGRTAVITGTARSQTQIDRIRRQLRLEPGVSRIESQVRLVN